MPTNTEPIVVQIVNEGAASVGKIAGGSGPKVGGKVGGGSGIAGALGKLGGVLAIAMEIASLVKEAMASLIRPVRTVVVGILKMVAQLLRPVSDMLLILLIPILHFLKPLVKAFNEMMKPFRVVAFKLMAQATKSTTSVDSAALMTGAMGAIIEGFSFGIAALLKELLKLLMSNIVDSIKELIISPMIELFKVLIPDMIISDDVFDSTKQAIFSGLDAAKVSINSALDDGLNTMRDVSLSKYNALLKEFGGDVDWKTPEQILAEKMSAMLTAAARKAAGKAAATGTETLTNGGYAPGSVRPDTELFPGTNISVLKTSSNSKALRG
jgi:hypothetical protein